MRRLYTVGYPDLSFADQQFIEAFRKDHDPHFSLIRAHFTMVFGVSDLEYEAYLTHIKAVAENSPTVRFSCRYAMLGADDADETAYVFLVPDEGYSAVSLLHDRLYTGQFERFHRLDIPYIPHITMASSRSREEMKMLCTELNRRNILVSER